MASLRIVGRASSNNLTDELRAQGLKTANALDFNWENNVAVGGPFKQDKLWWFTSLKLSQNNVLFANTYFPDGTQADSGGHVSPNGARGSLIRSRRATRCRSTTTTRRR